MLIMRDTDNRFVNLEKKIGLFVLSTIFILIFILAFVAYQGDYFAKKINLYTVADSGKGLIVGMPVKLSGFKIGKLNKLYLDDLTKVKLELSINKDYAKWIKTNSRVVLAKEGLFGEFVLEITPGSKNAFNRKESDSIPFDRDVELSEIAEDMRLEVKRLIDNARNLIAEISSPQGDVKMALKNVNQLSVELLATLKVIDESVNKVGSILNQTEKVIDESVDKVDSILNQTDLAAARLKNSSENIDSNIPKIIDKIENSLSNIEQITKDMDLLFKEVSPKIPATVRKGDQILDGVEEVLGVVRRQWPINKGIKEKTYDLQSADSYD